jgi:hypothetical protein
MLRAGDGGLPCAQHGDASSSSFEGRCGRIVPLGSLGRRHCSEPSHQGQDHQVRLRVMCLASICAVTAVGLPRHFDCQDSPQSWLAGGAQLEAGNRGVPDDLPVLLAPAFAA